LAVALAIQVLGGCEGEVTGGAGGAQGPASGGVALVAPAGGHIASGSGGGPGGGPSSGGFASGGFASGGRATGGFASGGRATGGVGHAEWEYAGTIVNIIDSGDEVIFRSVHVGGTMCVLVPVLVEAGGSIVGPIAVCALPAGPTGCLTATPADCRANATAVSGTITGADGGLRFDVDLHLTFPDGQDWLASSVDFRVSALPLDGVWYPGL
jgi:hypothetical protein